MESAERATAVIFPDRDGAHASLQALEEAGFRRPWMAVTRPVAAADDRYRDVAAPSDAPPSDLRTDHGSEHDVAESSDGVFGAIGRFFSGEGNSLRRSLEDHGIDPDEAAQIDGIMASHGAVVVVDDDRAAAILVQHGGQPAGAAAGSAQFGNAPRPRAYDAATDVTSPGYAGSPRGGAADTSGLDRTNAPERIVRPDARRDLEGSSSSGRAVGDDPQTIQLREERLRIDKERVSTGEARVGKRVIAEKASVDVPVMHEELFVERRPVSGRAAGGTVGDGETIVVPLSREEVRIEKTPVVREEVTVGQRRVEGVHHIDETLSREELDVTDTATPARGVPDDGARASRASDAEIAERERRGDDF